MHNSLHYFNSTKVRLKRSTRVACPSRSVFQFHKGPIKTKVTLDNDLKQSDFNSTKVRLKPEEDGFSGEAPKFQFHKGPIKTADLPSI